jgi:crotonobetaine/carnitine-CoA ligase
VAVTAETLGAWTVFGALDQQVANQPDKRFVQMIDGGSLSYRQASDQAEQVASLLQSLDVNGGDRVACLMTSSLDLVRLWLGAGRSGAVFVPLNTELTGFFLSHQLNACRAEVVVASPALINQILQVEADLKHLRMIVVADVQDGKAIDCGRFTKTMFSDWQKHDRFDGPKPSFDDIACIIYTSGTTGPSKGVLLPHAHCYLYAFGNIEHNDITSDDIFYIVLPLFHVNGLFMQLYAALLSGASAVVRPRFSASAFLDEVIDHGITITYLLGFVSYIFAQPPSPRDRQHRLRRVQQTPNFQESQKIWAERYGISPVTSGYGMTEVNICAWSTTETAANGSSGRPYSRFFDVIIADPETGIEVSAGNVGEILVRPKVPGAFMAGYDGLPEATVNAWRDLWFHTGDAGRIDERGVLFFIDRMKDCIRRGGENISSYEVELAISGFGSLREIAAYPVPADQPGNEDEVMVSLIPEPDTIIDIDALSRFVDDALPRFARPRYVAIVDELPRTATSKVKKSELKKIGVTASTIDLRNRRASGKPNPSRARDAVG